MAFVSEFKKFALRGNVVDLAIGIVIGAAFQKIVSSLVNDILTPAILTPALSAANLTELNKLVIPGTAIKYGNFISEIISFIIVAFALFIIVNAVNKARTKDEETPVTPVLTLSEQLLKEIRDNTARQVK